MPRIARERSSIQVYHVILRGVNKQQIFECADDYLYFVRILQRQCGIAREPEYLGGCEAPFCSTEAVLRRTPIDELTQLVNCSLTEEEELGLLDVDTQRRSMMISDQEAGVGSRGQVPDPLDKTMTKEAILDWVRYLSLRPFKNDSSGLKLKDKIITLL